MKTYKTRAIPFIPGSYIDNHNDGWKHIKIVECGLNLSLSFDKDFGVVLFTVGSIDFDTSRLSIHIKQDENGRIETSQDDSDYGGFPEYVKFKGYLDV